MYMQAHQHLCIWLPIACPKYRRAYIYMPTLTRCQWIYIRGREKENCLLCFLGLYFWKRSRNTGTSGFSHCLSVRLFKHFFFSWPPYSRDQSHQDIAGTCSCPPLLLRPEFSFNRWDVFWSSLFWLVSRLSWWEWKREEEERASWS